MKPLTIAGLLVLTLSACSVKLASPPAPSQAMLDTFRGCTWHEVAGKTLSIWSFACGPDSSSIHLVADETLPGFALVSDAGEAGMTYTPVIRTFAKTKDETIDAILPQIRKASPGPQTATCALIPAADPLDPEHSTRKLFQFAPTGAAKAVWDNNEKTGGDGTPPCGEMGVSFAGDRLFEVMDDDPARVVYIDYGSEIQIFDTTTLKALPAK